MTQRQLLAKRIGLVALTNILVELNSLIMLPLLTKNLPASEYGVWVQISVTIGLVPAVALLGLPYSMIRFLPSARGRETIQEIFYTMAVVISLAALVVSLAIFLLAKPIASVLFDGRMIIVQALSLLVLVECLISIPFAYFRSVQQIKKYSAFNFGKVFLSLLFVIYFVISGKGIMGAVTGYLTADVLIFLAMSLLVVSDLGITIPKFNNMREYLAFGMPTIPGNLSSWIVNSSNRYVIGLLMGTTFVGYFSPGYTLGNMISLFVTPISFILPAALSKHYDENDTEEVKVILGFSLKSFLMLGIPAAFGISLLSRPILNVLSTPEIASHGYKITPFMAMGALFLGAYAIIGQILILGKNTAMISKVWISAAVLNLILSFLLVPHIGIIGAAIASLASFSLAFIATAYYSHKYLQIELNIAQILRIVAAASVMSIPILLQNPNGTVEILISIATGALVYFVAIFALKGLTKKDLTYVRDLL